MIPFGNGLFVINIKILCSHVAYRPTMPFIFHKSIIDLKKKKNHLLLDLKVKCNFDHAFNL